MHPKLRERRKSVWVAGLGVSVGLGLGVGTGGCGGSPPAPQAPALARSSTAAPASPPPDLSPVAEPKTLVASARLAKPSASLAVVHAWTKLPTPGAEQVTELVANKSLGPVVDLDRPIDVAIAVSGESRMPQAMAAVSAAVKDPNLVRAMLSEHFKLVPAPNGATLIQGPGDSAPKQEAEDDDDSSSGRDGGERTCELAPAYGDAPVRLVCGTDGQALAELGPWLTRTATRASAASDLHVDVRLKPVRAIINEQKRFVGALLNAVLGARPGASGPRKLIASAAGDLADFASDLDTATVDVTLGDAGATASTSLALGGSSSALGRLLTEHPERGGPAPAAFWRLPADADFATFQRGVDEPDLARARGLSLELVAGLLRERGVKDADSKAVLEALGRLASSAPGAYASGLDIAAAQKALAAAQASPAPGIGIFGPSRKAESDPQVSARLAAAQAMLGWRLFEMDEAPERAMGALKDLAAAWSRPGISAAFRAKATSAPAPVFRLAPLRKGAGLAAGAVHYVLEIHPFDGAPSLAAKLLALHFVVVPDGARTWIGVAGDEALAVSKVAAALGQGEGKLSSRADLAGLKGAPLGAAGFFTLRGLVETVALNGVLFGGVAPRGVQEVTQLPGLGTMAIPFSLTAPSAPSGQPGGAPAAAELTVQVPRGAIDDVLDAAFKHGAF